MDTPDRADRTLPTPFTSAPPALSSPAAWAELPEAGAEPTARALNLKVALRAARRHWWHILGLWVVGTAVLAPLIYYKVKPTYESFALLKVDSGSRSIITSTYDPSSNQSATYLETQVTLISSPDVLGAALQDPKVAGLPRYRNSLDAESELRKDLQVMIVPRTNLIRIAMSSLSPTEPPIVVNAVLDQYMRAASNWVDDETKAETLRLKVLKTDFGRQVAEHRATIEGLINTAGNREKAEADKDSIPVDVYRALSIQAGTSQMELEKARSMLEYLEQEAQRSGRTASRLTGSRLEGAITTRFYRLPEALRLKGEMVEVNEQLDKALRLTAPSRQASEPVVRRLKARMDGLQEQWQQLWDRVRPDLEAELADGDPGSMDTLLRQARHRLQEATIDERLARERLAGAKVIVQNETEGTRIKLEFAQVDLAQAQEMLSAINRNLNQIEYDAKATIKANQVHRAKANNRPASDNRMKLLAGAPAALLLALVGLFVLVEAKSGRVADPDDLPARVRLGVIGVVPPLPTLQPARGLRAARSERRRVEEFVQSLDHLRVALCSANLGTQGRRCLLITSATGGEGKTTLAAQLAGRCANAGLLTLLIDADLRRPSLGELLEVPEGPGLVDVLAGEATPEEVMVVIGNAGGFHLLPAGSPAGDPSRLLQGPRLGDLIARFRETFDVVIVDAPPVLAVPDALILGRWVDGAVLAVRHDTSRFPLVERANRRLAAIGIPVLGAVVNGVRPMEAAYGGYSYSYSSTDPEAGEPTA